jgi:hypothetical protein
MITVGTSTIRSLFSTRRPIDRPIEKVIDYYATDDRRLLAEVEEYEVTDNVERNLRRFLEVFGAGVRRGDVTETGIWVSGFYGSGKSSFTKYLGFALDPKRTVEGRPFLDLLCERISSLNLRQELKTLSTREPVAVIMLDLGSEQLAASSVTAVSTVLYWKVLQWAGYSRVEKLAQLEFRLDRDNKLNAFQRAYQDHFDARWDDIHSDPLLGVARADKLVPRFYPREFAAPGDFSALRFTLAGTVRDLAQEMLDLIKRKTGRRNVLFLIDEAGQYVAPRGELILNLDGLARTFKELGKGRVWIAATGQQTLAEIVERAAYNSAELNKLRDRFPVALDLDARDIREITWKRLLTKSSEGEAALTALYRQHGQALETNTRLAGSALYKGAIDEASFVRLYPFLPQHFDLLMELVRTLARSTGGIGLRSAIRVIQDVLVDSSKVLPAGTTLLADMPLGRLATVDQFFDTLRADIGKVLPHVLVGVDRVATALPRDDQALRVAKALGALQPVENFPRTVENVAALLYARVSDPPHLDAVRAAVQRLLDRREIGLVDDPQSGGLTFLSEGVKPLREKRNRYVPTTGEISQQRSRILKDLFAQQPSATLEGAKTVRAGVRLGSVPIVGEDEEVHFRLEVTDGASWNQRRTALLAETTGNTEWKAAIAWLLRPDAAIDDLLVEVVRSNKMLSEISETQADKDVAQFVRSERKTAGDALARAQTLYRQALLEGTLIFRGKPTGASAAGSTPEAAANKALQDAAREIYPFLRLVPLNPKTDLAAKFLGVDRLDRMPKEADPLGFVTKTSGKPHVDVTAPALAEALRVFREKLAHSGAMRLQGNALQDLFAAAPFGWSKDATRYVFAALLLAGEVVFHTSAGEVKTSGPLAIEAVKNTQAFGKVGVTIRDTKPTNDMLDRAASRLEGLFGTSVLPLEDHISRAVREHLPARLEEIADIPPQLRLLRLGGSARAEAICDLGRSLLGDDGAAAISVMGAAECAFPADMAWTKQVNAALDNDAASDVDAARDILRDAGELAELFPQVAVVEPSERDAIGDILASGTFYSRLAELRTLTRTIRDRARQIYRERHAAYVSALTKARSTLERLSDWLAISEADRDELGLRLLPALAETPPEGQEIGQLRVLLVRENGVSSLREQVEAEVKRRLPELGIREDPSRKAGGKARVVATIEPIELEVVLPAVIAVPKELDRWLAEVRTAVTEALATGKSVRLRVSR